MIQIAPQLRILVGIDPIDFRCGIDGIARICREKLAEDPFSGTLFVFRNRRSTAIKILAYDGSGYWLHQKRLSCGRFRQWPTHPSQAASKLLFAHELQVLIYGGNPNATQVPPPWRRVTPTH